MPDWWHEEAASLILWVDGEPRGSDVQWRIFGERLAGRIGRATPWTRSWLQRVCRREERWTLELVQAMHLEFIDMPRGFFIPRDFQESAEMAIVEHKTDQRLTHALAIARSDVERKKRQIEQQHRIKEKAKLRAKKKPPRAKHLKLVDEPNEN